MKRFFMAILLTGACVCSAWAQNDSNRQTIPFSDPSRPGTLIVRVMNNAVTIKAYDGKAVTVESAGAAGAAGLTPLTPQSRNAPASEIQGLRRIDSYGRNIAVDQANNTVTIQSNSRQSGDLLIQVPVRTNIRVNANQARTTVEGVDGEIEINAVSDVTLTDVAGSVLVNSTAGKVTASLRSVTPDKPMSFVSVNGTIDVTLPAGIKASVRARTLDGEIYTGFDNNEFTLQPVTGPSLSVSPTISFNYGARLGELASRGLVSPNVITVAPTPFHHEGDRSASGAINGGGPNFEFRTLHGNIYIRKGK